MYSVLTAMIILRVLRGFNAVSSNLFYSSTYYLNSLRSGILVVVETQDWLISFFLQSKID